jgi:type IV pilus assembly protein PilM
MALFGGKRGVIGLDIGSSSIKVAELRETKKGYALQNFGMATLPPEAIVDGALMNSAAIVEAIQTLINERKIKTREVVTSVSGQSVMIKKIPLPAMTEEELEDQIQWEAEQYIPFDINDVNLDFQILKPGDDEGNMEVLLVAAKKDMINDYVAVITESGLTPVVVDVDAFALENMYEINYQIMENEVLALVNIGASVINIAVTKNGQYMFSRDVSSGGKLYSEEIQKQLSVSYEEAEMLKLGGAAKGDTEEVMRREVSTVIRSVSDQLAGEIARSLDFYQAAAAEEHINKIWLSGGSCRIPGLAEVVQEKQNIPVEILDPFRNVDRNPKQFDPGYLEQEVGPQAAVVVGLATRRVGDK